MLHTPLLYLHSYNRWLVLVAAAMALGVSLRGWLGRRGYGRAEVFTGRAFHGLLVLQVLLGLVLYAVSPIVHTGLGDLGAAMGVRELRFFTVEHITGMLIALAFADMGAARVKRAASDPLKLRAQATFQLLAVISILISVPWWRPLVRR